MIPKKIFYIWFGSNKPQSVQNCIDNWKDKLLDFELIEVNEASPYFDFKSEYKNCQWLRTVYDRKMWAFVSDYVRVKVLYDYGGVYLDTDITIEKDLTPLLNNEFFIGEESPGIIGVCVFGTIKKHPFLKDVLDFYQNEIFQSPLYTIPTIFTSIYSKNKYDDVCFYEPKYFYPFPYGTEFSPHCITSNTYCIHWWNASWLSDENLFFLENKQLYFTNKLEFIKKERQEKVKQLWNKKLNLKKIS